MDTGVPGVLAKPGRGRKKTGAPRAAKPKAPKAGRVPNPCFGAALEPRTYPTEHYAVRLPFAPSNKQLLIYAQAKGHKLVMNTQNRPPTPRFDEDALRTLMGRYPKDALYPLVGEYREIEKCLGTYVDGVEIAPDGRLHEVFKHTPKTLRLAMQTLQLLPRVDEEKPSVYNDVRKMYVAAPGHVLLARDYSGIEAVLVAYLAADPHMLRLTRLGVHDFVASHAVEKPARLSWSDADILEHFSALKKFAGTFRVEESTLAYDVVRQASKRAVYLSLYGGTSARMVQVEPSIFPTRARAQWYQDLFFSLFPSVKTWHWAVCEEAEQRGYAVAANGFRLHYQDVFTYSFNRVTKRWEKKLGETAKECIASKPQHLALWLLATSLVSAAQDEEILNGLCLTIHDEIFGEWPVARAAGVDARVKAIMERPFACLPLPPSWGMGTHLSIATEGKMSPEGGSWGHMRKIAA